MRPFRSPARTIRAATRCSSPRATVTTSFLATCSTEPWNYLLSESGAPTVAERQPGGHQLTTHTVHSLGQWITHRLAFIKHHDATHAGGRAEWPTLPGRELPHRAGPPPTVSWTIPQQQESDNAPAHPQERLFDEVRMHGVPSAGIRFDELVLIRGSYSFNVLDIYRLDLFVDHARGRDPFDRMTWRPVTGTGVAVTFKAPWNTMLIADVGKSFLPDLYRGSGSVVLQVLLLKPL